MLSPVARGNKRAISVDEDGTPSPIKRMRLPRTCTASPINSSFVTQVALSPETNPVQVAARKVSYNFFDCALRRCHVEDLFELSTDTPILLLVPEDDREIDYFSDMAKVQGRMRDKVHINGRFFLHIDAIVYSNPKQDMIFPLMSPNCSSTLIKELYTRDEGINIAPSHDLTQSFQMIWKRFHSQPCGMQIWATLQFPRPVDTLLRGYKSEKTINNVFNYLRLHVEGDELQSSMLCSEYRNQLIALSSNTIKGLNSRVDVLNAISFDSKEFKDILKDCDSVFEHHLVSTLAGWNNYGSPLMPPEVLDKMIETIKKKIPHVWHCLANLRGLHTKNSCSARRAYLMAGKKRGVLFQLFSMARGRNNKYMVNWALIMPLSQFCRGTSRSSNVMANYFGVEVSRTLLNLAITKFKKIIKDGTSKILFGQQEYIFVFDNSQIVTIANWWYSST
jgi:hypothetical protein